jgi:predicted dehydrogenase
MLNIGIIGCGKITEVRHAPEYSENPNCRLVAFYDVMSQRAEVFANQYNGKACTSIDELLASNVDAVSVCVANIDHATISIQALKAGKHVLCEKPMATTLEDCEAMLQAQRESGKFLMIGQNQRLAKSHVKAKEILDSGEMGKLISFQMNFSHQGPEGWTGLKESWFFDKRISSFGAMADLGVHKTDLIYFLTRQKIVKTSAVVSTLDKKYTAGTPISVDDNAFCIYTLENGVVGTIHVSWTNYGMEDNSTKLYCTGGVIHIYDDKKYSLMIEKRDGETIYFELDALTSNKEQTSGGRTSTGVIDAFVNSIITNTPPDISGESVMLTMKVIFANLQSATLDHSVLIEYGE